MPERQLLIATNNPGKAAELRLLLAGSGWEAVTPAEVGIAPVDVIETGRSYLENAVAKAVRHAEASRLPSLADDSGLEVDALEGRPGPHSARYGGAGLDDAGRVELLLRELRGVPRAGRGARFVCVAALVTPGGEVLSARGECPGEILAGVRGRGGFGYDPVFQASGQTRTMAELSSDEKNRISHRARALQALFESYSI